MFILLLALNSVLNSVRQQKIFKTHINSKHTRDLVKSTIIKYYCLESSSGDTTDMYRFFTGGLGGKWDGRPGIAKFDQLALMDGRAHPQL